MVVCKQGNSGTGNSWFFVLPHLPHLLYLPQLPTPDSPLPSPLCVLCVFVVVSLWFNRQLSTLNSQLPHLPTPDTRHPTPPSPKHKLLLMGD
ncbi:hypothetical protein PN462_18985 [Spirulina sp. CS-785/01]|uniref:hypothetical protein n=1 Tax=Spirulina sp. CS-785/01 TaxID=3021716 RepID=UPI00232EB2E4|nr:hypothetical protein [Spirulina sp. CS-785/01]MDB9315207.1 hypothetical protein [Spirulina sp. CS-785/01]